MECSRIGRTRHLARGFAWRTDCQPSFHILDLFNFLLLRWFFCVQDVYEQTSGKLTGNFPEISDAYLSVPLSVSFRPW